MAKDTVSFREMTAKLEEIRDDIKEESNKRFDKIEKIFSDFHKDEFEPLIRWKENLTGKIAVVGSVLVIGVNFAWDFLMRRKQ